MKELLVLLEDQLHARGINLHILTGICAGITAQPGYGGRVVEGDVRGDPVRRGGVLGQAGRGMAEVDGSAGVTGCGGVLVQLGGASR